MALGTNNTTVTTAANYIPELWSDEVIAGFAKNIVMANLVTKFEHTGKRGDTINVPNFTRGSASAKAAGNNQVTLIGPTHGTTAISLNKHYEYSVLIEDIVAVQALDSLRQMHTADAGVALSTQIDTDLIQLGRGVQGGSGNNQYNAGEIGGDGTTTYSHSGNNESALTDAGLRTAIQVLDDADVPDSERSFVVPPSTRNTMIGLSRFTEQAFTGDGAGSNTIRTGRIGNVYGVEVYVSSNADTTGGSASARVALLLHKSALGLAMQQNVRTQTQYKQEYLSDLMTADVIYGVAELRNDAAIALIVPA